MALTTNDIAFIGLANEYCQAIEQSSQLTASGLTASMLRLLPRIYIAATDLQTTEVNDDEDAYLENFLDEDYYEALRRNIEHLLGPDDTYLEVFEQDMKYSDTPIAASISESLCDIFQVLYNFITIVRDASPDQMALPLAAVKADFREYWSQPLCNVLRALNSLHFDNDDDI